MDEIDKIISVLGKCSVAGYDADGNVGSVYLPTEQIGVIVGQALSLRSAIAVLEDELKRATIEAPNAEVTSRPTQRATD